METKQTEVREKPTPRPWKVGFGVLRGVTVEGPNGEELADIYTNDGMDEPSFYPASANAGFIVAAVNSHDALIAGLQKIFTDNEADCGCECNTETCCNRVGEPCSKCDARAALDSVKGTE